MSNDIAKKDDPVRISEIMMQINKAAGKINQLEIRKKPQNDIQEDIEDDEEEFDFGGAGADNKKNNGSGGDIPEEIK